MIPFENAIFVQSAIDHSHKRDFSELDFATGRLRVCLYVSNALIICNSLFVECAIVIFDGFNFVKQIPDISN